eukprot:2483282-Rhodomonas_salina.3
MRLLQGPHLWPPVPRSLSRGNALTFRSGGGFQDTAFDSWPAGGLCRWDDGHAPSLGFHVHGKCAPVSQQLSLHRSSHFLPGPASSQTCAPTMVASDPTTIEFTAPIFDKYEIVKEDMVEEYGAKVVLFKHKKTGAEVMSVSVPDENKVFGITFRTPPNDSTGVPHILEHRCSSF